MASFQTEYVRFDHPRARTPHTCDTCGEAIVKGELYVRETTPPWYGEAEGDVDDEGRPTASWVNTHKWKTGRFHELSRCPRYFDASWEEREEMLWADR